VDIASVPVVHTGVDIEIVLGSAGTAARVRVDEGLDALPSCGGFRRGS
jgi:hypothetical protein